MQAVVVRSLDGPAALELARLPVPEPDDGEVLVRVVTVGANHQDAYAISGRGHIKQPGLPLVPGNDPAGEVVAAAGSGSSSRVGERVVVKPSIACGQCRFCSAGEDSSCLRREVIGLHRQGGMAEYVAVPASNAVRIPAELGYAEATALSQSLPVALHMARDRAGIGADDTVLVTGAAGAIGAALVQVALLDGATVIAAAGGAEHTDYVRTLGPQHVIDYRAQPAFGSVLQEIAPDGVTLYLESVGDPAIWKEAVAAMARRGRIAVCGSIAGPIVELDLNWLFRTRMTIIGSSGSTQQTFADALDLAAGGDIRPRIDSVRPLEEVRAAFERLADRDSAGKVILRVAAD
jgi:NADPH:quinone reductase-like Zn-dependent oxidoreductase